VQAQTRPPTRLYILDGLRLVAALLVVMFHFTVFGRPWGGPYGAQFPELTTVTQFGWLGVELFFLISGFVICLSADGRSLEQFATARVIRLYPAYWAAVLVTTVVVTLWPVVVEPAPPSHVMTNLTMFQSFLGVGDIDPVYWTLNVELRFYLLFGLFVLARGYTTRRVLLFASGWLVASLFATDLPFLDMVLVSAQAPYFVAGIALYLVYRHGSNILLWGLVGASWLIALQRLHDLTPVTPVHAATGRTQAVAEAALVTFFFVLVALVATHRLAVGWRWLSTAGALTYPLYLLHEIPGWTMIRQLRAWIAPVPLLLGTIVAVLVLSWLVHRYVERPLSRRMKRWFSAARESLVATAPTTAARVPASGTGRPLAGHPSTGLIPSEAGQSG
jgi:peptidoglycan/LPS O-acetylase OafA/YrhL